MEIDYIRQRRMLMKLRGGTAELRIETGRWCGLRKDKRIYKTREKWKMRSIVYCTAMVWQRKEKRWYG